MPRARLFRTRGKVGGHRMGGAVATGSEARPATAVRARSHYRPQLDGLRAVAVYLVVAFHAGIHSLLGRLHRRRRLLRALGLPRHAAAAPRPPRRRAASASAASTPVGSGGCSRPRSSTLVVTAVVYTAVAAPADVRDALGGIPVRVPLRRQLALHPPVERLLRAERQHQPGRALLVARGRGAVLPLLAAHARRRCT